MKIGGHNIAQYIQTLQGTLIRDSLYLLSVWNMDVTPSIAIPHGLSHLALIGGSLTLHNDAQDYILVMQICDTGMTSPDLRVYMDAVNINIERRAGGMFDAIGYSSVLINRGYLLLKTIS